MVLISEAVDNPWITDIAPYMQGLWSQCSSAYNTWTQKTTYNKTIVPLTHESLILNMVCLCVGVGLGSVFSNSHLLLHLE